MYYPPVDEILHNSPTSHGISLTPKSSTSTPKSFSLKATTPKSSTSTPESSSLKTTPK